MLRDRKPELHCSFLVQDIEVMKGRKLKHVPFLVLGKEENRTLSSIMILKKERKKERKGPG